MVKRGRYNIWNYITISQPVQGRTFSPVILTKNGPHIRRVKIEWYAMLNLCYFYKKDEHNTDLGVACEKLF